MIVPGMFANIAGRTTGRDTIHENYTFNLIFHYTACQLATVVAVKGVCLCHGRSARCCRNVR